MCIITLSLSLVLFAALAPAAPIDTRQFGLLRPGMSQVAVVARVGAPDDVTALGSTHTVSPTRGGGFVVRGIVREAWDYIGTRRFMPVRLIFGNGRLLSKHKGR